ncbi:hypothetical protein DESC_720322 [Desulfosarcina cetonica]|nr:hypothetical protein DESC_720322 [Desulfosarcina cetonica]
MPSVKRPSWSIDRRKPNLLTPFEKRPKQTKSPFELIYGDVAQLGERSVRNAEARGSIPLISTIIKTGACGLTVSPCFYIKSV